jgi:hypothetical protein
MKNWPYVLFLVLVAFVFTLPLISGLRSINSIGDWELLRLTSPSLSRLHNFGRGDWDYVCFQNEVARTTIIDYAQFPLWNPYASGGRPLLANHQNGFLRPLFILSLAFGCVIGSKLEILLMIIAGMLGMFLLGKHYNLAPLACVLAALVFGFTSFFSLHMAEGHFIFLASYLTPYIFLFYLKSFENKLWAILSAAGIALVIFWGGAAYALIPIVVFLGIYALVLACQRRSAFPIVNLSLIFMFALGFAAVKLVPTIEYSISHPRLTISNEITPLTGIYHILLNRQQGLGTMHITGHAWHEYGAYVGWLPLILFIAGLALFFKPELALLVAGAMALAISIGDFSAWSPWHILHEMPLLKSTHVPSRFVILFIFTLAIIAAKAFDFLFRKSKNKWLKCLFAVVVVFVAVDLIIVDGKVLAQAFPHKPVELEDNTSFKQVIDNFKGRSGASSSMLLNMLGNNGTLNAYEPVPQMTYAIPVGNESYKGEVYLENGGNASFEYWSPNKLFVNVQTINETKVVINQNYADGWRVGGRPAENVSGLLAATITPAMNSAEFSYMPISFIFGACISALTIIVAFIWQVFYRKQSRAKMQ